MHLIIILLLNVYPINCYYNITETTKKIRSILTKYKNDRYPRCTKLDKIDSFVGKTLKLVENTEGIGEFLKTYNVSECSMDRSADYLNSHILDGLIIHDDLPESHWHEYKSVHNKNYSSSHHETAAQWKWRDNLRRIARHNRDFLAGKQSYSLHLNFFGDFDVNEYFRKFLKLFRTIPMLDPAEDHDRTAYRRSMLRSVPSKLDWRSKGFRPRLEEQHQCGACYAFAVTHALQAQLYKKHGFWGELRSMCVEVPRKIIDDSPQQIVDCSGKDGNMGCDGGSLRAALRYAAREGLITEAGYPYVGKKERCKYNSLRVRVRARRWAALPAGDEDAIERTLATVGPLAVGVNAAPFTFQLYRSGVYDDMFCTPWQLNHAMLLVGYTPHYWILLNWWGKNWGEDGYIRIRRGFNRCGITNMATYVEL